MIFTAINKKFAKKIGIDRFVQSTSILEYVWSTDCSSSVIQSLFPNQMKVVANRLSHEIASNSIYDFPFKSAPVDGVL